MQPRGSADRRVRRRPAPILPRLVTRRPMLGCLFEIVETLVLTLIIFFVIQNFVAQPYKVQQQSMEHTLEPDQYVLVDKLTPRFDTYKRGDIVVFTPPPDWVQADDTPFIKRVIGVGGDTVEIRDGQVYINGTAAQRAVPLRRAPARPPSRRPSPRDEHRWVIPAGELFLMGDHRAELGRFADLRAGPSRPRSSDARGCATGRSTCSGSCTTPTYPELAPPPHERQP